MLSLRVTFQRMGEKSECCRKKNPLSSAPACMLNLVCLCLPALLSLSFSVYLHMHYSQTSFSFQMVGAGPHLERNVKRKSFCRT